jgi:hypothetical protein
LAGHGRFACGSAEDKPAKFDRDYTKALRRTYYLFVCVEQQSAGWKGRRKFALAGSRDRHDQLEERATTALASKVKYCSGPRSPGL